MAKGKGSQVEHVLFVGGDKGGVGKSTVAIAAAWYAQQHGGAATIDADPRNPNLHRIYPGTLAPRLETAEDALRLLNTIESADAPVVIIDTPAGYWGRLEKHGRFVVEGIQALGAKITVAWVLDRGLDSINLLRVAAKGPICSAAEKVLIARNTYFGEASDFQRWEISDTRQTLLADPRFGEVTFPALNELVADKLLAVTKPVQFESALSNGALTLMERIALEQYLRDVEQAMAGVL
jgi:hypothetical protein